MSSEPFIVEDACQKVVKESELEESGNLKVINLATWNRETRYPDGRMCGATVGEVEDRWHAISESGKIQIENLGII